VSRYQKGKTNLDFTEARDSEWQWHQLGHIHLYTFHQTHNHASTPSLCFFTGRMPFLPPNQQHRSTEGITQPKIRLFDAACTGSMKRSVVRLSVRPSVCSIDRQQQQRAAGLLLHNPRAGDIDR